MPCYLSNVEEEAHCYVVQCRQIVCGQYVADYLTTECRTFRPEADEGLQAKTSCIQLLNNLLRIAHKLFAYMLPQYFLFVKAYVGWSTVRHNLHVAGVQVTKQSDSLQ